MIYVISDCHFSHENILKYEEETRPFKNVEEMNEELIKRWNAAVDIEDTVIVVGDFFMGQITSIDAILPRLNGKIILVRGNHDTPARVQKFEEYGIEIHDIYYKKYKGKFFVFCHFPTDNLEFLHMIREDNSEVILCYGHVHSKAPAGYFNGTFHVGVDTNNLAPVALEDIWKASQSEKISFEDVFLV